MKNNYLTGALIVLASAFLFSTKAVMVKLAYEHEVDSVSLLALRMLFALPFYLFIGISNFRKDKAVRPLLQIHWWKIVMLGVCGYYLASLFDFLGLQYITASLERVILFTYPTIVLLLSAFFFKERISSRQGIAVLITYFGIAIAFLDNLNSAGTSNFLYGALLTFGAAIAFAIYIVGSGQLVSKIGTRLYNSLAMSSAALSILIHHFITNDFQLFHFTAPVYYYAMLMAIFATVIPSFLITEGIRRIGANNAGIIGSIGPISTIMLAYVFLGERLNWIQWLGTLLVIIGVLTIVRKKE